MPIHIQWTGPHKYSEAIKLRDGSIDYGIYQVYGAHPLYGSDVLIYIGKADQQTLGLRISQHSWAPENSDFARLSVYVGRLSGYQGTPSNKEWSKQIEIAERLLIRAHKPAANGSGLNVNFGREYHEIHVLNWGEYRDLLPEVSGARHSDIYSLGEGYKCYSL